MPKQKKKKKKKKKKDLMDRTPGEGFQGKVIKHFVKTFKNSTEHGLSRTYVTA